MEHGPFDKGVALYHRVPSISDTPGGTVTRVAITASGISPSGAGPIVRLYHKERGNAAG